MFKKSNLLLLAALFNTLVQASAPISMDEVALAIFRNDLELVKAFTAEYDDLNEIYVGDLVASQDYRIGSSLLMLAIRFEKLEIFKLLLANQRIDINAVNELGMTPLMFAVTICNKEMVSLLIKHGADLSIVDTLGYTALSLTGRFIKSLSGCKKQTMIEIKNLIEENIRKTRI